MLRNIKYRYDWTFKNIIRCYNLMFLISVALLLVFFVAVVVVVFELKTTEG